MESTVVSNRSTADDSLLCQELIIGVFDALGFKDRVLRSQLSTVVRDYRHVLRLRDWSSEIPVFSPNGLVRWHTRTGVFSDTIFLWARADAESIDAFLCTCSILMAESLKAAWPLRGGVACGPCVMDASLGIFVGEPIISAVELEKSQEWVGAALDESCSVHPVCGRSIRAHEDVCSYRVPTRWCGRRAHWAVRWRDREPDTIGHIRRLLATAPRSERSKYKATLRFLQSHP